MHKISADKQTIKPGEEVFLVKSTQEGQIWDIESVLLDNNFNNLSDSIISKRVFKSNDLAIRDRKRRNEFPCYMK